MEVGDRSIDCRKEESGRTVQEVSLCTHIQSASSSWTSSLKEPLTFNKHEFLSLLLSSKIKKKRTNHHEVSSEGDKDLLQSL